MKSHAKSKLIFIRTYFFGLNSELVNIKSTNSIPKQCTDVLNFYDSKLFMF